MWLKTIVPVLLKIKGEHKKYNRLKSGLSQLVIPLILRGRFQVRVLQMSIIRFNLGNQSGYSFIIFLKKKYNRKIMTILLFWLRLNFYKVDIVSEAHL